MRDATRDRNNTTERRHLWYERLGQEQMAYMRSTLALGRTYAPKKTVYPLN